MVQKYPVRPSHRTNLLPEKLLEICRAQFEGATLVGGEVSSSYGALSQFRTRAEGRDLWVDVTMNPQVPEEVARETIRRYNTFLEEATGYSSKERAKRLRKMATAGDSGS